MHANASMHPTDRCTASHSRSCDACCYGDGFRMAAMMAQINPSEPNAWLAISQLGIFQLIVCLALLSGLLGFMWRIGTLLADLFCLHSPHRVAVEQEGPMDVAMREKAIETARERLRLIQEQLAP